MKLPKMKKYVFKLDLHDERTKQKAMKIASGLSGVDSISFDTKDHKLTVTGDIDPTEAVRKLRTLCHTEIVSVGPIKEPAEKKEEPMKEEPKKPAEPVSAKSSIIGKQHSLSILFSLWRKAKKTNEDLLSWERLRLYRRFTFKELQTATNNFRLIIHADDCSTVYKGYIDDGHEYPVAIRRFKSEPRSHEHFLTEIKSLSILPHHPNIISLIGYCFDGPDYMFTIYEYMSNGTLRDQLHEMKDHRPLLPWKRRLQICIGVARGLECLHTGTRTPSIIHRDIKSSNILLKQNWVAKISGFELSHLVPTSFLEPDHSHISTAVVGTLGYLDLEYMLSGQLTMKSDLYSFGVVLFEVLSGRKPSDRTRSQVDLIPWARDYMADGRLYEIVDPRLMGEIASDCLKTFADLAYNCTNERGNERPSIAAVAKRLELVLLLQKCMEADIPFSLSRLKSIVQIQDSDNNVLDYDIEDLLRD